MILLKDIIRESNLDIIDEISFDKNLFFFIFGTLLVIMMIIFYFKLNIYFINEMKKINFLLTLMPSEKISDETTLYLLKGIIHI